MKVWPLLLATVVASPAWADEARCMKGLEHAAAKDLPRASLYLEGCEGEQFTRTRADVAHKLENSQLSALSIVTTPEGLVAETDAMPGERFATPATIWTKAGDYKVNVATDAATLDAGRGLTTTASLDAFSRRTVIINLPTKKAAPRDGKIDFSEETPEQTAHSGPPAAVKHGTMMPKKYLQPMRHHGPQLEDPFAVRYDGSVPWRIGARIGGGMFLHGDRGAAFTVAGTAARTLAGPVSLSTRLAYAHRDIDAASLDVGLSFVVSRSRALVLSASAAMRGEVRVQDELAMQPVSRVGVGAAVGVEAAPLWVPIRLGLRVEPSFSELVPGARNHNVLFEVGYDWR